MLHVDCKTAESTEVVELEEDDTKSDNDDTELCKLFKLYCKFVTWVLRESTCSCKSADWVRDDK